MQKGEKTNIVELLKSALCKIPHKSTDRVEASFN